MRFLVLFFCACAHHPTKTVVVHATAPADPEMVLICDIDPTLRGCR